ncbi:MAG: Gfo/Idh/MocA family oxidoreductase [Chitinophagaceae bacterium]|nr:Gfo/Idh/MocA family oxidoreductase [Chitinophagaceae bacterium]
MVKIGVLGAGHLGKIHIEQLLNISTAQVIGFFDPNNENANLAIEKFGIIRFENEDELIDACDAIDIVTPTILHFELAIKAIKKGKHVFIEKPIAQTSIEAEQISKMVQEANVKCQVGHVERFNPAFVTAKPFLQNPLFIEVHRLAQFNPRGTDVSVVFDLMIHDLDIVLSLVNSEVKRISASGVKVISETVDIANVRLEFGNGCVANITTSRISLKNMRKMRIFQRDAYISIDFLNKKNEIVRIKPDSEPTSMLDFPIELNNGIKKTITVEMPIIESTNAIRDELILFLDAIINDTPTAVSADEGNTAVKIAEEILRKINNLFEE